jgi:hypothetical protein
LGVEAFALGGYGGGIATGGLSGGRSGSLGEARFGGTSLGGARLFLGGDHPRLELFEARGKGGVGGGLLLANDRLGGLALLLDRLALGSDGGTLGLGTLGLVLAGTGYQLGGGGNGGADL